MTAVDPVGHLHFNSKRGRGSVTWVDRGRLLPGKEHLSSDCRYVRLGNTEVTSRDAGVAIIAAGYGGIERIAPSPRRPKGWIEDPWAHSARLHAKALDGTNEHPERVVTETLVYDRNPNVREDERVRVLLQGGTCPCCGVLPYIKTNGEPGLEVHHVWGLGDGGPDAHWNVLATCAECHRIATNGRDKVAMRAKMHAIKAAA